MYAPPPRILAALLCPWVLVAGSNAFAQDVTPPEDPSIGAWGPWGGTALIENSLGRGTFAGLNEDRRPLWTLLVHVAPTYTLDAERELVVGLSMDVSVNVVENADSGNTTPHQLQPGDLQATISVGKVVDIRDGSFTLGLDAYVAAPTSRYSQYAGKLLSLHGGVSASWTPISSLTFGATFGETKHLYVSSNATLDPADFDAPPLGRSTGAESLADGRLAIGGNLTSHALDHGTSITWSPLESLSIFCGLDFVHSWTSAAFPDDGFASPYADAGRGQSDLMYGTLEVSWAWNDHLSLSLGSLTEQTPKTADNERLRFPFWDLTNGADNRQVIYLGVVGSL